MSTLESEPFQMTEQLPQVKDQQFSNWLMKQFFNACRRQHRWKTHCNTQHGRWQHRNAQNLKRCIRACALYEIQRNVYQDAIHEVGNLLSKAMDRGELSPVTFKSVMETLEKSIGGDDRANQS